MKRLRVIAGPNGSGKTTLYRELKDKIPLYDFINADEIKLQTEDPKLNIQRVKQRVHLGGHDVPQ